MNFVELLPIKEYATAQPPHPINEKQRLQTIKLLFCSINDKKWTYWQKIFN